MKSNSDSRTGAALVIAVAAAAVVLLSASLLLGYLNGMLREQGRLEVRAQARLSEASAIDWLRWQILQGGLPDSTMRTETGGMMTEITPGQRSPAPPLTLDLGGAGSSLPVPSPGGEGIVVAELSGGNLLVSLLTLPDLRQAPGYPLSIPAESGSYAVAGFEGASAGYSCMVAVKRAGGLDLYLAGTDGSLSSTSIRCPGLSPDARASAGIVDGEPVLLLSGSGGSFRVSFTDGHVVRLQPMAGTCPVFLDGGILCVPPDGSASANGLPVLDVVFGDFDQDGSRDVAWATSNSMTAWTSSRQGVTVDGRRGQTLAAWGLLEQVSGLACRWAAPDGASTWTRLSWTGFQEILPSGPMRLGWRGRLDSGGNLVIGVLSDSLVMASAGGDATLGLGACTVASWGLFDGNTIDAACFDGAGWRLVLDPEDGGGVEMPFTASTTLEGEPILSRSFSLRLYSGESGERRVYGGGMPE